jgi:hypothetical protein
MAFAVVAFVLEPQCDPVGVDAPEVPAQRVVELALPFLRTNAMISLRPVMKESRSRQAESMVYACATRSGSRVFQASSAACTFFAAVSRVDGGQRRLGFGHRVLSFSSPLGCAWSTAVA